MTRVCLLFLNILSVVICWEKCEDLVFDLHNESYYRTNFQFDLNQTCQYTFIIPNDSIAYVDISNYYFFDSWYEFENSLGDKYTPKDQSQRERYNFPPPYFYLRFYLVGDNLGYTPHLDYLQVEPAPLPFATATVFNLKKKAAVVPIVRYQGANVLKFVGDEGVVLHVIPPLRDYIDQWKRIFLMNGTQPGGNVLGSIDSYVGSTIFNHSVTLFYDDLNFGAVTLGSSCIVAVFDSKDHSSYEQFYVEPASTKTFTLGATNKPCGIVLASQSSVPFGVEVTSFYLLPFELPANGVLYIYGGAPFRNNSNLLHTITAETMSSFTFPMIFNGYIYSFILHNASISLPFTDSYNVDNFPFSEMNLTLTDGDYSLLREKDKTGYRFTSEEEHLFYMSITGRGSHFSVDVSPSTFAFGERDGIVNWTTTELILDTVTPYGILTITSKAEGATPVFILLLCVLMNGYIY